MATNSLGLGIASRIAWAVTFILVWGNGFITYVNPKLFDRLLDRIPKPLALCIVCLPGAAMLAATILTLLNL